MALFTKLSNWASILITVVAAVIVVGLVLLALFYWQTNKGLSNVSLAQESGQALVLDLNFDEGESDIAYDASGNNNGIVHNAIWKSGTDCYSGSCLEFDGQDDYVEVLDNDSLDLGPTTDEFQIEAWINLKSFDAKGSSDIVFKDKEYWLRINPESEDKKITFFLYDGQNWEPRVSAIVPDLNKWYHVVAKWDGYNQKIYVNDELKEERAHGFIPSSTTNNVWIGKSIWGPPRFNGIIDEIKIYNKTLNLTADHLKYYGYYHVHDPCFGLHMQDVASYTNIVHLWKAEYVNDAAKFGMKSVLELLFTSDENTWDSRFSEVKDKLVEDGSLDDVLAIFIVDEPSPNKGWTNDLLERAVVRAKEYFPNKITMINFDPISGLVPPDNLDWIAVDAYFHPTDVTSNGGCTQKDQYNTRINEQLPWARSFGKPVILIGQSFHFHYEPINLMPSNCQQNWYYKTAKSVPEIIGLIWFMYGDATPGPGCGKEVIIGTNNYPDIISFHKEIGKEILCSNTWENNLVCGNDGNEYTNPDQAKCQGTTVKNYGLCECVDSTDYGKCSQNKPKYCDNGNLIDKCSVCGCPSGKTCQNDGSCKVSLPTNQAPILNSIGDKTIREGEVLTFTISASDPDGDTLVYSATNLPFGASFNSITRIFNWAPENSQIGQHQVTFAVSDGQLADSETIVIRVEEAPTPQPTPQPIPQCLPDGTLIKLPTDPKVYVIINCRKKWIRTVEEFQQKGYKWEDVQEVSSPVIEAYNEYLEAKANLLRAIGHHKVYRVINGKRLWIPTIAAFNAQGLKWEDIEDVSETTVDQYPRLKLARIIGSPKIYYLTESGLKRWIPTIAVFNSYNNKWEDVVEISPTELNAYPDNDLIRLEGGTKVYKLENGKKRWIKTTQAFIRLGYNWNKVAPCNQTELDYYPEEAPIE